MGRAYPGSLQKLQWVWSQTSHGQGKQEGWNFSGSIKGHIEQLKSRTRCHRCKKFRRWKKEGPLIVSAQPSSGTAGKEVMIMENGDPNVKLWESFRRQNQSAGGRFARCKEPGEHKQPLHQKPAALRWAIDNKFSHREVPNRIRSCGDLPADTPIAGENQIAARSSDGPFVGGYTSFSILSYLMEIV